jgi:hypothetical protein
LWLAAGRGAVIGDTARCFADNARPGPWSGRMSGGGASVDL